MFRYIALNWAPQSEPQSRLAARFAECVGASPEWQRAYSSAGLLVYAAGCKAGVNQVYVMPSHRGVVLGRLFRGRGDRGLATRDMTLSALDDARIIDSDGQALIDRFWGRWVAFLPSRTGEGRVLRDPSGTLPCYRLEVDGVAVVFSWLEEVLELLDLATPPVSWDALAATLVYRRLGARETALQGVTQVLAGELAWTAAHAPTRTLWSAARLARSPSGLAPEAAAQRLRDTVTDCVRAWMSCYDSIVLRLSGGVDSAVLLGSLFVEPPSARVVCLNYHSPGSDSDERQFARLAAAMAGCRLIERHRDDGFQLSQVLEPARTPAAGSHIGRMGSDRMDAEVARSEGAAVLFTGAGGDQLFQEVRSTWPAADYLRLRGLDSGFPGAVLDAARLGRVSFWRALRLAFMHAAMPPDPLRGIGQHVTLMPAEVLAATLAQAHRFLHPDWLGAPDLPIGKRQHLGSLVCPFDYYNAYAPATSPELVHPLMSQPLLELCLALPTFVLTAGGRGRAVARRAFADRIPAAIAERRSKGGTETHVTAVLQRSLPLARSLLLDGELARRGLIDRQRAEAALAGRPSARSTYTTEIHAYIAVEAWLRQMRADAGGASL